MISEKITFVRKKIMTKNNEKSKMASKQTT